ncbi:MAG: UbiA family prenyltransferase [Myxococcota bacterium]|nr:UbiA family prenyltransferase [Myxococcota bacterium]
MLRTALKVSRPGLWFQTIWLYVLPLSAGADWRDPVLWLGLFWVCFPLSGLVYGWNDWVDWEIDQHNPRKDSWLFGARAPKETLGRLMWLWGGLHLVFSALFVWLAGWWMAAAMAGVVLVNATYNAKIGGLRGRPPFDLINPLGYLLVVWISARLNGTPPVPWPALAYLAAFCAHAQLVGEVMDYWPDTATGRKTTATLLGVRPTKGLILLLVLGEGLVLGLHFGDWVLGGMLLLAVPWLLLDLFWLYKERQYTQKELTLAGLGMNGAGLVSMGWVLWSGSLMG